MFSSTFKTPANNRNIIDDTNTVINNNNKNEFTKPLITSSSINENSSTIYLNTPQIKIKNESDIGDFGDKFVNCLPDLNNIQKPRHSNLKAKIYNFLERPTGW